MNDELATEMFLALSNLTRLAILKTLVNAGAEGMLAGSIAEVIGATPSRTSFHLSALSECGLINSVRQSRQISYSVDFNTIGELMNFVMRDCCNGNATVLACCSVKDCC